jgi:hypothetical protein
MLVSTWLGPRALVIPSRHFAVCNGAIVRQSGSLLIIFFQISETRASKIPEYIKEGRRFAEPLGNCPRFRSVRAWLNVAWIRWRAKRGLAVEPRRVDHFPSLYSAADPSSDKQIKTLKRNMKTHILLAFVGLATGSVLPALAQQKDTVDPKSERQIRVKKLIQVRS